MTKIVEMINWFAQHIPEVITGLSSEGASNQQLDDLERTIANEIPTGLRELYNLHDGEGLVEPGIGIFYGLDLMSVERVQRICKSSADTAGASSHSESENSGDEAYRVRQPTCTSNDYVGRMPFAHDGAGNFLAIDYKPTKLGVSGQVISCGVDEDINYFLSPSFDDFIDWYLNALNKGEYSIDRMKYAGEDEEIIFSQKEGEENFHLSMSSTFSR